MKSLLITVDAWRASHASFLPDVSEPYTPALERFADDAVAFTQAVSHGPATPYAFPSLFTSTLPLDYGGYERITTDRPLLSEALAAGDWHCHGVHGNPWLGARYGYGRGYETYRDVGEFSVSALDRIRETLVTRFGLDHPVYRAAQSAYRHASGALDRLGATADEVAVARNRLVDAPDRTFVWVHLLDPHAPYVPSAEHRRAMNVPDFEGSATSLVTRAQRDPDGCSPAERRAVRRLYAAAVHEADARIETLLDAVDDETLVVVTADHGEALFEHGQVGHEPALYDELVRVPLLVRPPASSGTASDVVDRQMSVVDQQVQHLDVAPTILDYAGCECPSTFQGRSLRPLVEGGTVEERLATLEVASTRQTPGKVDPDALQLGVRSPVRKLVRETDGTVFGYDLVRDPGELDPIDSPSDTEWRTLREYLLERGSAIDLAGVARADREEAVERRLRDLGYLD